MMGNELISISIKDIILSISNAQDKEIKEKVLEILNDCRHLDKPEKDLIFMYESLCNDVGGVPTIQTLVAKEPTLSEARVIINTSLVEYTKIFVKNKQTIKMNNIITESTSNYISGKISFDTLETD